MTFHDRADAGRILATKLLAYRGRSDVVVLGLPRGGVPVAEQVARVMGAPLDVFLVRKLGVPGQEELAMGAVAGGGVRVRNEEICGRHGIDAGEFDRLAGLQEAELARKEHLYRQDHPAVDVAGKTAILVDDGLATGATMRAAVQALRAKHAARVVAAVPIGARESCEEMSHVVDDIVCAVMPVGFRAVGQWYEDFSQTSDDEVRASLDRAAHEHARHVNDRPA